VESVDQGKFSCGKCGKSYKWKPELAGKKVKCKCGNIMTAPATEPVAEQQDVDLDGLYELAAEEKKSAKKQREEPVGFRCPSCNSDLAVGAVVCTRCGFNLKTGSRATAGKPAATVAFAGAGGGGAAAVASARPNAVPSAMIGYGTRNTSPDAVEVDYIGDNPLRDFGIPAALLLAGVGVLMFQEAGGGSISAALPRIGLSLIINLVFSFIGMFAVMKLFEVSFGAPGPALIKAAACCVLPPAIAGVIGNMIGSDSFFVSMMVSAMLMMPLTYACFYFLFDMDFDEVIYLVVIIWLVNQWVVTFLLSMMLSGGGGGGAMSAMGGFGGGGGGGSDSEEVSQDEHVKEMMGLYDLPEVGPWLAESPGRIFGTIGRGDCDKMVQDLQGMGAKKMYVNASGSQAGELFVEMPKDKDKRKQMLEYHAKFTEDPPLKDTGQKWLVFEFIH
jgi:hypothetical protein